MSLLEKQFGVVSVAGGPCRLAPATRALAARALAGEFGQAMQPADFALSPAQIKGVSSTRHAALAVEMLARNAPTRVLPDERVAGAATVKEAAWHRIPLTDFASTSHTTLGFEKGLKIGYRGLRQQIMDRLARSVDGKGRDLLESMLICLDAAAVWQARYAAAVEQLAFEATEAAGRADLLELAGILRKVPEQPPDTFREAVQSLWSMFAFQRLGGNWPGIGRIDQMLGGYLRADLAAGHITLDEARDLLAHFWIKGCEWIGVGVGASGDAQYYQNIVLAGCDEAGREVTNEVTYLVLDIVEELHISDFPVAVRVNSRTPDRLLQRIAEVQRRGGGIVAIYNEDVILTALARFGYSPEEAAGFANDGCWEIIIPGKTAFSYRPFDTLQILQSALGLTGDGPIPDFSDFEQLYAAFHAGLARQLEEFHAEADGAWSGNSPPTPLVSLLVEDCIGRARAYQDRGAIYNVVAPHAGGLPDSANSLHVIRKAVFEEALVPWSVLAAALRADWRGHEELRRTLASRYELYGNDNPEADAMLRRVYDDYVALASRVRERNGVLRPPGISTFGREIEWLPQRRATPYGRRSGDILATNLAPTPGSDKHGPTAVIKSFCKLDFSKLPNGVPLELKILPSSLDRESGINALVALMRSFVELGGVFLHIDVVDSELLRAAQREPEKYPNLVVRISGWSARFATLDRNWQEMIIQRTQQRLG